LSVTDPYIWMENLNDVRVISFVERENNRFRKYIGELSKKLEDRIKKYMFIPIIIKMKISDRGYFYLTKEKSFKIFLLKNGEREKLIDSNSLGENTIITDFYIDDSGRYLIYKYSYSGSDKGFVNILDLDSGEIIYKFNEDLYSFTWISGEKFYYIKFYRDKPTPDGVRPPACRVFLMEDGVKKLVFGENLETNKFIYLRKSYHSSKVFVTVKYGWISSKVYGGDIDDPSEWNEIYGGDFIVYPIEYIKNRYYLLSYEGGGLGKIISIDGEVKPIVEEWIYPLRDATIFDEKIIANYLINASSSLIKFNLDGTFEEKISLSELSTIRIIDAKRNEILLRLESFTIPYKIYSLDKSGLKLIDGIELSENFMVEERWIKSKDNIDIHVFIVRSKGVSLRKIVIHGYGGFNISLTPKYRPISIPFLIDGGVFVIANIRGGGEFGEKWHRAGIRERKQNVFNDFISVLEYFKKMGSQIVAIGRSNGGLLVGGVLTQRPDLLDGAVIGYPVLDMLRYHKLYIGRAWIPEYGDPNDPEDYKFLRKYSPYHNVRNIRYPPILIYTGLGDDRVHPAHALKFAARLKDINAPVFLRIETHSGHSGAVPDIKVKEYADILAFIYKVLKLGDEV